MLVFFALGNSKVLSFALGDATVPNANGFASRWNIGIYLRAYILLQRETTRAGSSRWVLPPTQGAHVANANMLVSKNPCGPPNNAQHKSIMPNASL